MCRPEDAVPKRTLLTRIRASLRRGGRSESPSEPEDPQLRFPRPPPWTRDDCWVPGMRAVRC